MEKTSSAGAPNRAPDPALAALIAEGLTTFAATGQPYVCHLPHDESIDAYAELVGVTDVRGLTVLRAYYDNPVSGGSAEYDTAPAVLDFSVSVGELLQNIASSYGGLADFPNDFLVGVAVQTADGTCVAFGLEQEERVGICGDCVAAGYDQDDFGCGHLPDEYRYSSWLVVCRPDDVEEIDWERGDIV